MSKASLIFLFLVSGPIQHFHLWPVDLLRFSVAVNIFRNCWFLKVAQPNCTLRLLRTNIEGTHGLCHILRIACFAFNWINNMRCVFHRKSIFDWVQPSHRIRCKICTTDTCWSYNPPNFLTQPNDKFNGMFAESMGISLLSTPFP